MKKFNANLGMGNLSSRACKILIKMKLTLFFLIACTMSLLADDTYSQVTKLNLHLQGVTIKEALTTIEDQSEFYFMYSGRVIDVDREVSVNIKNKKIDNVLEQLFAGTDVNYTISDRIIVLTTPEVFRSGSRIAFQQHSVTGTVTDANGTPLPGVNIVEKGTTTGAVTDLEGNYSINVSSANATLVFSFIGYLTEEIEIAGQTTIDIVLVEDLVALDEVVVVGYGTVKKRDISTSVSSVSSDVLDNVAISGFDEAIKGKMAGVRIATTNAAPGGGQNIQIRGINSISNSTSPLIVLDGFPLTHNYSQTSNPLNNINPADISSIEVLKDASAAAIYGSRASAGVIIITTRKGKTGVPSISFEASEAFQHALIKPEYLNRDEFLNYAALTRTASYLRHDQNAIDPRTFTGTENFLVQPNDPYWIRPYSIDWASAVFKDDPVRYDQIGLRDLYAQYPEALPNTNWYDVISQPGRMREYQLGINGGTEKMNYYISGGYFNHKGIIMGSEFTRFSALMNIEAELGDKLKIGMKLNPVFREQNYPMDDVQFMYDALATPPIYEPYDQDGNPVYLGNPYPGGGAGAYDGGQGIYRVAPDGEYWGGFHIYENPVQRTEIMDNERRTQILSQLWGEYEFIKGLEFRSMVNASINNNRDNEFYPSSIYQKQLNYSTSTGKSFTSTSYYYETNSTLTYTKIFADSHDLNVMAGYSAFKSIDENSNIEKQEFTNDITWTLNNAAELLNDDISRIFSGKSEESYIGIFGRMQYNYKGKYYATTTIRRDGSSKFGSGNRWGLFPSGSVAWRISDENFMEKVRFIDDLKIRVSYGVTGNSNFNNRNISHALLSIQQYVLNSNNLAFGYREKNISNPDLKWEETFELNMGIDATFLKDRLDLTIDAFTRETKDLIWNDPVPSIMGQTTIIRNVGSVANKGIELSANGRLLTGELKWNLGGNITFYKNEVTALGIKDERLVGNNIIKVGHPLGLIYTGYNDGTHFQNYEESTTIPWMKTKKTGYLNFPFPGTTKIIDINGSGLVDADDKTVVGCAQPDFYFGINSDISYKNLEFNIGMNGAVGMEILNTFINDRSLLNNNNGRNNIPKWFYDDIWTYDNPTGKYPLMARKNENPRIQGSDYVKYGSYYVENASFLNISSMTLAYNFEKNLIKKIGLNSTKLYLNVSNAFIFTKSNGYNPEYNKGGDDSIEQGIDNGAYPMARTIKLGVKIEL